MRLASVRNTDFQREQIVVRVGDWTRRRPGNQNNSVTGLPPSSTSLRGWSSDVTYSFA